MVPVVILDVTFLLLCWGHCYYAECYGAKYLKDLAKLYGFFSRIFQFENFNRTRKRVLAESNVSSAEDDEAIVGMFVTLHVKDVPRHLFNSWKEKNEKLAPNQQVWPEY